MSKNKPNRPVLHIEIGRATISLCDLGGSLRDVIRRFQDLIPKDGDKDAIVDVVEDFSGNETIQITTRRLETTDEYQKRCARLDATDKRNQEQRDKVKARKKKLTEDAERGMLKTLMKKYPEDCK